MAPWTLEPSSRNRRGRLDSIHSDPVHPAQAAPVLIRTFNYAIVAVAVVLLGTGAWWVLSARKWFTGPRVQGTHEELAAIEAELEGPREPLPASAPSSSPSQWSRFPDRESASLAARGAHAITTRLTSAAPAAKRATRGRDRADP